MDSITTKIKLNNFLVKRMHSIVTIDYKQVQRTNHPITNEAIIIAPTAASNCFPKLDNDDHLK